MKAKEAIIVSISRYKQVSHPEPESAFMLYAEASKEIKSYKDQDTLYIMRDFNAKDLAAEQAAKEIK